MKSKVLMAVSAALLLFAGCSVDNDLVNKVDELDSRVSALEEKVKELNSLTIPGLQSIVASIEGKIYVTAVAPSSEGYVITFSNGTTAVIKNGKDGDKGDKGDAPQISVVAVDGEFYWAIDGTPVLDPQGNKVPVNGGTPMLRINQGKWEVSYDKGQTWQVVEQMGDPSGSTISIEDGETTVTFYINGEAYEIQKELPFYITFEKRTEIAILPDDPTAIPYTLVGAREGDEIEVDILNIMGDVKASVVSLPAGDTPGYLKVQGTTGKIFVYASNGKGKTDIKSLVFEEGQFSAEIDVKTIPAEGGEAIITVVTNFDYELWWDKTQKWIAPAADTKAVHTDIITFVAQPNTTGNYRACEIDIILENSVEDFIVLQAPSSEEVTSIASLANVDNYVSVTLYNEPVVAASEWSVVVSDGTANLYVPFDHFDIGTILNITGFNSPDGFTVTNVTPVGEGGEVVETDFNYYAFGQIYSNIFTAINGTLEVEEGVYSIVNDYGEDGKVSVIIEAPVESLGFAEMTPGNLVAAKGYIVGYMDGENDGDQIYMMVAADANEAVLTQTGAITYSNEGGDSFLWDYDKPYMQYAIYNSKIWDSFDTKEEIVLYTAKAEADNYQYDILDAYGFFYTPAEIAPLVLYSPDEAVEMSSDLPYGEYVVVAVSMDEYGRLQGPYGYLEMEKVEPEYPAATYDDYLGKWIVERGANKDIWEFSELVKGESYTISGFESNKVGVNIVAKYSANGTISIEAQRGLGTYSSSTYGDCDLCLFGRFYDSEDGAYYLAPSNATSPYTIAQAAFTEDGNVRFIPKSISFSDGSSYTFSHMAIFGETADKRYLSFSSEFTPLPMTMTRPQDASDAYKKWLGDYTLTVGEKTVAVSVSQNTADASFSFDFDSFLEDFVFVVNYDPSKNSGSLSSQAMSTWNHSSYGSVTDWVYGWYTSPTSGNPAAITGTYDICDVEYGEGTITFKNGKDVSLSSGPVTLEGFSMYGKASSTLLRYVDYSEFFTFPMVLTKSIGATSSVKSAKNDIRPVSYLVSENAKVAAVRGAHKISGSKVSKAPAQVSSSAKLAKRTLSK